MILPASYRTGFAPRDGYPAYPELWRGCVGAWAPCLGPTGLTLRDWSGRQNHGTLTNMVPGDDWLVSGGRYALDFDGTDDFVSVGLPFGASSAGVKAISLWYYPRAASASYLVTNYDATSNGFSVLQNSDRTIGIARTGVTNNIQTTTSIILSRWTHIFVEINTTGVVWINGIETARGTMSNEITTTNNVRIGGRWVTANSGSAALLNAQVDDVIFYNRPLNQFEIRLLASRRGIAYEMYRPIYYTPPISASRRKILTGQV